MSLKLLEDEFVTLGGHWIPHHNREAERIFFGSYFLIDILKIIDSDIQQIHDVLKDRPDAILILRDYHMSEDKAAMERDPIATGKRHAKEWRVKIDDMRSEAERRGLYFPPDDQIVVLGINEPAVWVMLQQTVDYYVAFLDELSGAYGLYGGALSLSVGWPANTGTNTPPNWEPYQPVYDAILRGGHILVLHEYWSHLGPHEGWRWWAGRYLQCPWNVPILIAESGVDEYVVNGNVSMDKRGWGSWMDAEAYTDQLLWYSDRVKEDKRIIGFLPFTSDYASEDWVSFDMLLTYQFLKREDYLAKRDMFNEGYLPPDPPDLDAVKIWLPFVGNYVVTQDWGANPENYRPYEGHTGIDYGLPMGTEVVAAADGVVIEAGEYGEWGNYVKVAHGWGHSVYAHLSEYNVVVGQGLDREEVLGLSGSSGRSSGPHLHFGIRINPYNRSDEWNGYSDPNPFFQEEGGGEQPYEEVYLSSGDKLVVYHEGPFSLEIKEES